MAESYATYIKLNPVYFILTLPIFITFLGFPIKPAWSGRAAWLERLPSAMFPAACSSCYNKYTSIINFLKLNKITYLLVYLRIIFLYSSAK